MKNRGHGLSFLGALYGIGFVLLACRTEPPRYTGPKLKGANLVAPPGPTGPAGLEQLRAVGANWVAVVPYGFCRKGDPHFYYFGNRREGKGGQWWGETPAGVAETVRMARQQGFRVMLKPHVWMQGGSHLDLAFDSERDWQTFEADYARYVLDHARLADSLKVDLYCITTELDRFATARPAFWNSLIRQVRTIYKGPLTYAANWDRYDRIPFWKDLDFVGVDAYFPLSEKPEPAVDELSQGWKQHLKALASLSGAVQKPVLFTEFGYRACQQATYRPWESETECVSNAQAQANAYRALLQTVWPQPWFAGGFLWKWFMQEGHRGRERDQFSPQGRPAAQVLAESWKAAESQAPNP